MVEKLVVSHRTEPVVRTAGSLHRPPPLVGEKRLLGMVSLGINPFRVLDLVRVAGPASSSSRLPSRPL